jgi:D-lactate dehydrogenase
VAITAEFLDRLRQCLPAGALHTEPADCWAYGYDNSKRHALPEAVAFPTRHDEVVGIVRLCNEYRVPLTPRGRGTGTTGAVVPLEGGLTMSLERMNRIIELAPDNRFAVVEPGLTNQALQDALKPLGFFWAPDPTSAAYCSVGGNLAYNSAGPRAVKYGTPRDNVFGLRAVTGDGRELRTGVCTSKGVVGLDLTRLIVGSEGTLAVITEATLKLTPLAEAVRTMRAVYVSVGAATRAIARIMAQALTPCALEFMDAHAIEMIRQYSAVDLPTGAGALLMIEVDGPVSGLDAAVAAIEASAQVNGLLDFRIAHTALEVEALWRTRKALSPALRKVAPGKINEDVVVPVTELPALISGLDGLSQKHGIPIVNFGHAGNGNIHVNLLLDPAKPGQVEQAVACLGEVFALVLGLRGTLSGEHGIGLVKRDYVSLELDAVAMDLMRAIKRQFDPNGILNRGKMLPDE